MQSKLTSFFAASSSNSNSGNHGAQRRRVGVLLPQGKQLGTPEQPGILVSLEAMCSGAQPWRTDILTAAAGYDLTVCFAERGWDIVFFNLLEPVGGHFGPTAEFSAITQQCIDRVKALFADDSFLGWVIGGYELASVLRSNGCILPALSVTVHALWLSTMTLGLSDWFAALRRHTGVNASTGELASTKEFLPTPAVTQVLQQRGRELGLTYGFGGPLGADPSAAEFTSFPANSPQTKRQVINAVARVSWRFLGGGSTTNQRWQDLGYWGNPFTPGWGGASQGFPQGIGAEIRTGSGRNRHLVIAWQQGRLQHPLGINPGIRGAQHDIKLLP